jgi:Ca2+-binding EF-hand superfamily protein
MDAEIIMKNIFEVFDTNKTGKIVPNELLWILSMSVNGKGTRFSLKMSISYVSTYC